MFSILLACGGTDPSEAPRAEVDPRDQYALLADIEAAKEDKGIAAYRDVRDRWLGRRYQWEVLRAPALCASSGCYVIPFDSARYAGIVREGWLPHLDSELAGACDDPAGCVVTFEGRLAAFQFSPEELTSLAFEDVALIGARPARPGESWGQRHVPGRGDLDAVRARAEKLRAEGYTATLSVAGER